ncbi:MAG: hypothetical protein HUJ73_06270, partial [Eubacterium sp.]|nr:hypothetical protein [Eubacterium sp.]
MKNETSAETGNEKNAVRVSPDGADSAFELINGFDWSDYEAETVVKPSENAAFRWFEATTKTDQIDEMDELSEKGCGVIEVSDEHAVVVVPSVSVGGMYVYERWDTAWAGGT